VLGNRAAADAFFNVDETDKRAQIDDLIGDAWSDALEAQLGGREAFQNARGVRYGVEAAVRAAFAASDAPVSEMKQDQRTALAGQAVEAHLSQLAAGAPQHSAANRAVARAFMERTNVVAMVAWATTMEEENAGLLGGLIDSTMGTAKSNDEEEVGFKANLEQIRQNVGDADSSGAAAGPRGVSVPSLAGASAQKVIEWAFAHHPADLTRMPDQEKWDLAVDALEAYLARQAGAGPQ